MFCCDVGDECADEQRARKKLRTLSVDASPTPSSPLSSPPSSSDGDSDSDTETVDYDYDTTRICDMRRSKPQPPPLETLSADGTIYYCPVLPNAKDFAEAVHEETHDVGSYVFISLGKDPEGLWKGDVNWGEDTGEYREDARNEEVREMVFAAFREKVKETEEVKLYGVFPRFWGWVAFKAGDAGQRAKNSVRVVEEAGVWVNYISFAEWQDRIEHQYEDRKKRVPPRGGPIHGIDPLEAPSGSDNFKIIEQRRNDIRLIQNIQERQEEARKNLRQERLEDLCKKRPHISLKAGKIWKSVTHAIRRIEVCCPLFVGLDRTWSIAIFEGDVIGCSHKWWDFQYDYKEKEFRDVYEKPHAYIWYETPFVTPALQYANLQLNAIPKGLNWSGHFNINMAIATDSDNDLKGRPYLLDTGSSLPMGYIDDICEVDPTGERPPQTMIAFDTTLGRISRFVYLVYMQVRDENEKALTGWHLTPFAINETPWPKVPRLSGLFPFQHLYWAKDPGDPEFWSVSNVLAGVTRGLRKRLGDDLREVENGKEDEEGEGEGKEEDGRIEVVVKDWVTAEEVVLRTVEMET